MTLSEPTGSSVWVPSNAEQIARRRRLMVAVPAAAVLVLGVVASFVALPNQSQDATQAVPAPQPVVASQTPTPTPTPTEEPAERPSAEDVSRDLNRGNLGSSEPVAVSGFQEHKPEKAGEQYATEKLNVREEPSTDAEKVAQLEVGDQVDVTDKTEDGWQEVIVEGSSAWVSSEFLSDSKPSTPSEDSSDDSDSDESTGSDSGSGSGSDESDSDESGSGSGSGSGDSQGSSDCEVVPGVTSNAHNLQQAVCAKFGGSISSYGGNRPEAGSNHNSGRAIDFMISDMSSGQAIADWVRANGSQYGVTEVIFNQQIWTTQRSSEGWRSMEDRGSPTANHMDHVHVSVG